MKTALITTTINVPRVLELYRKLDPDVRFFVAGDMKTPHDETTELCDWIGNCDFISQLRQTRKNYEHSELIGWNTDSRRNIALLEALKWGADLIVSMPKLKTHHWVGATLSLKNMFGAVPGAKYGWPKNVLHWCGDQSIAKSIVDINLALRPGFAIIDGIEGMEGDGPLRGETVRSDVVVMGEDLTAVDATAARVMGLNPERISYLQVMQRHGGTISESRIEQLGEPVSAVRCDFKVLPPFAFLKLVSANCGAREEKIGELIKFC